MSRVNLQDDRATVTRASRILAAIVENHRGRRDAGWRARWSKLRAMQTARDLFSYRKHWAHRFGPAPFLPMSQAEMDELGWESSDGCWRRRASASGSSRSRTGTRLATS